MIKLASKTFCVFSVLCGTIAFGAFNAERTIASASCRQEPPRGQAVVVVTFSHPPSEGEIARIQNGIEERTGDFLVLCYLPGGALPPRPFLRLPYFLSPEEAEAFVETIRNTMGGVEIQLVRSMNIVFRFYQDRDAYIVKAGDSARCRDLRANTGSYLLTFDPAPRGEIEYTLKGEIQQWVMPEEQEVILQVYRLEQCSEPKNGCGPKTGLRVLSCPGRGCTVNKDTRCEEGKQGADLSAIVAEVADPSQTCDWIYVPVKIEKANCQLPDLYFRFTRELGWQEIEEREYQMWVQLGTDELFGACKQRPSDAKVPG